MDPYFRKVFLDEVSKILKQEPNRRSLFDILRTASPSLAERESLTRSSREKAFKTLKQRLRPEKDDNKEKIAWITQNLDPFYEQCCADLQESRKQFEPPSPTSVKFLSGSFEVQDKWHFLDIDLLMSKNNFPALADYNAANVAVDCVNARGAITYNGMPDNLFTIAQLAGTGHKLGSVESIFAYFDSQTKVLTDVDSIKQELTTRGPVVSASFVLSQRFTDTSPYTKSFSPGRINKVHEVLIVGWTLTELGEAWLVKPPLDRTSSAGNSPIAAIPVGRYSIDDLCYAPTSDFVNVAWQRGPYWDIKIDHTTRAGLSEASISKDLVVNGLTTKHITDLAHCFDTGMVSAAMQETRFVLRNKHKLAESYSCCLRDVKLCEDEDSTWEVTVGFL